MQYYFDNGEYRVDFSMPGSSKNKEKSQQRKIFIRNNAKSLLHKEIKGKAMFERLVKSSGRLEEASTSADLPNSYNQMYDLCRKQKPKNTKDDVVELVDLCNVQKDLKNNFIRNNRAAPELAVVVKNDQQLQHILKFCAMDHCWSIFGADPIFNICSYNITISTYCDPLLYNVNSNVHLVHPVHPTLIHSSKTFESHFALPSVVL